MQREKDLSRSGGPHRLGTFDPSHDTDRNSKWNRQKQLEEENGVLRSDLDKQRHHINKLEEKYKKCNEEKIIAKNDLLRQHYETEKMKKKHDSEYSKIQQKLQDSGNEQVVQKEKENQALLTTNSRLILMLEQAKNAKEKMEANLIRVFEEAKEVKNVLDVELQQY